jgi:hypothetical protein
MLLMHPLVAWLIGRLDSDEVRDRSRRIAPAEARLARDIRTARQGTGTLVTHPGTTPDLGRPALDCCAV